MGGKENSSGDMVDIAVSTSAGEVTSSSGGKKRKHSEADEDKPSKQVRKKAKKKLHPKDAEDESVDAKKKQTEEGQEELERSEKGQENNLSSLPQETDLETENKNQLNTNENKDEGPQINGSVVRPTLNDLGSVENVDETDKADSKGNAKNVTKHKSADIDTEASSSIEYNKSEDSEKMETSASKMSNESKTVSDDFVNILNQVKQSEDLDKQEADIPTPSKKYRGKINVFSEKFADFEKKKTPTAFVKRALSKTNKKVFGTPALVKRKRETPTAGSASAGKARRVSFNMKNNQSQC